MNTLTQAITALLDARSIKDERKERWLTLMRECSDEQGTAKQAFLTADEQYALRADELGKVLVELREMFCLEIAVDALPEELKRSLHVVVPELRFDHLLAPVKPQGLEARRLDIVGKYWRTAEVMLDAAKALREYCRCDGNDLEFEALRKESESYRRPAAWLKAVTVSELLFNSRRDDGEDRQERIADAVAVSVRYLQKVYDDCFDLLQTLLTDLHDAGALGFELNELEDEDLRRCLQDCSSRCIRQRQTQTETERQPRTVTTVETEAEEETEGDSSFDPGSN